MQNKTLYAMIIIFLFLFYFLHSAYCMRVEALAGLIETESAQIKSLIGGRDE